MVKKEAPQDKNDVTCSYWVDEGIWLDSWWERLLHITFCVYICIPLAVCSQGYSPKGPFDPYFVGTWWYKSRVLSQGHPHFPFELFRSYSQLVQDFVYQVCGSHFSRAACPWWSSGKTSRNAGDVSGCGETWHPLRSLPSFGRGYLRNMAD